MMQYVIPNIIDDQALDNADDENFNDLPSNVNLTFMQYL